MADRHKSHPKTVRMPGGLEAWYREYAPANATTVNAAMVKALEEFRERHEAQHATQATGEVFDH